MTDATLRQALAYARRGWPVFPCLPGQKIPATTHGYKDATTDEQQITEWFGHGQRWNLAIATGTPGPDVLDIDQHGQAGNGYPGLRPLASGRTGQRRRRLRTDPGRRNARLLRWLGPAQWPPAQPPPRLPRHRRLHRGPALPGRRQALPRDQQTRRPRHPRLGRRHPVSWNPSGSTNARHQATPLTAGSTSWPAGSPASPKATATPACTGPPTAPWTPTPPPT